MKCNKLGPEGQERGQQWWEAEEAVGGMEVLEMRPKLQLSPIGTGLRVPMCHLTVPFFLNQINSLAEAGFNHHYFIHRRTPSSPSH